MQTSPAINFCIFSRPLQAFMDSLMGIEYVLKVGDLAREDIKQYVRGKFSEEPQYSHLSRANPKYEQIVEQVAIHANGVFL